jgi:hypothetical protein
MRPAAAPVELAGGGRAVQGTEKLLAVRAARSRSADVRDAVPVRLEGLARDVEPLAVCR